MSGFSLDISPPQETVVIVVNRTRKALPRPAQYTRDEKREFVDFERRAHLRQPKVLRDKSGNVECTLMPLEEDERERLAGYVQQRLDEHLPQVGHFRYRFEPWGKTGCAWAMPSGWARVVCKRNPARLEILPADEKLPEGVEVLHHGAPPSTFEYTFHHKSVEDLLASPVPEQAWTEGQTVRDGIVTEQGAMLNPVGGGLPGTNIKLV